MPYKDKQEELAAHGTRLEALMKNVLFFLGGGLAGIGSTVAFLVFIIALYDHNGLLVRYERPEFSARCLMIPNRR